MFKWYPKSEQKTDRQTDRQTHIWTNRLLESIGPEGRCFEKIEKITGFSQLWTWNTLSNTMHIVQVQGWPNILGFESIPWSRRALVQSPFLIKNKAHTYLMQYCDLLDMWFLPSPQARYWGLGLDITNLVCSLVMHSVPSKEVAWFYYQWN